MKTKEHSEEEIISILKTIRQLLEESDLDIESACREAGVSKASYYRWSKKFIFIKADELAYYKQIEEENKRLKRMLGEVHLECDILREKLLRQGDDD